MPERQPKLAYRFLKWFCHPDLLEDVEGDLNELFERKVVEKGLAGAKWLYLSEVLKLFRKEILKPAEGTYRLNHYGMLKNYLTITFRVFKGEKFFAIVNVLGLALGITCSLFIYLWVQDELKYNAFASDRICYVNTRSFQSDGSIDRWNNVPYSLQAVLQDKYSAIEKAAAVFWTNPIIWKKGEGHLEIYGVIASPELFEVFDFTFIQGGFKSQYEQVESIVISASFAEKYYGTQWADSNVIGNIITNKDDEEFSIAGVIENLPKHSTLEFDFVIPYKYLLKSRPWLTHWGQFSTRLYARISNTITLQEANENVVKAIIDNRPDEPTTEEIFLQPYRDLYLYNNYAGGEISGGRIEYVRILSIAAVLILLMATINFMNLTVARSSKRAKEAGIRKVLGAFKISLRFQFLLESTLTSFFGLIASGLLILLLLPQFNELTGKEISLDLTNPWTYIYPMLFVILLGVISGIYPAFYISSFNPIKSIKGTIAHNRKNSLASMGLIIFQFVVTIFMITATLTVYQQISYVQNKNLGLERENLIKTYLYDMDPLIDFPLYKNKLLQMPGISGMTLTSTTLLNITNSTSDPVWKGRKDDEHITFDVVVTDPDFIPVTKLVLKEGRNFDWNIQSDTLAMIINETSAEVMRLADPVGESLEFWGVKGKIIGVVKDFHNHSLHSPIAPTIIGYNPKDAYLIYIRTKPGEISKALTSMQTVHEEFTPERTLYYDFVDDLFKEQYKSELMVKDLVLYFTILAIVISSLGLLGLVAYTAERRTKEIGIRKVLGATLSNIMRLLSKEYVLLIIIALIIALPTAYYLMNSWLSSFEFRTELNWWFFLITGIVTIVISLMTVGSQALKAAMANPVDSLRDE